MQQLDLFDLKPSRRKLDRKEKRATYGLVRWYLYRDVPPPKGDDLVLLKQSMEKLKLLRKNRK